MAQGSSPAGNSALYGLASNSTMPKVVHVVSTNATGDTMLYMVPEADSRQVVLP